jgi:hypothetical protein
MLNKFVRALCIFVICILLFGCGKTNKIDTAEKLANALKKQGVIFNSVEEGETKLRSVNEILVLTGNSLRIEILRIENETAYKTAIFAVSARLKFDKNTEDGEDKLQDVFYKKPFLVMIYQEPETGIINRALNKIFNTTKEQDS